MRRGRSWQGISGSLLTKDLIRFLTAFGMTKVRCRSAHKGTESNGKKRNGKEQTVDKKITTIIFDIGNVLVNFRWKEYIAEFGYDEETQRRVAEASVLTKDWSEYDRGVLTQEEILDRFVKNDPGVEKEIRRTYNTLTGLLKQYDYTKSWIRELKDKGYRVLYLSNFSEKAETECEKEMDFIPLTDGGILSYKVKLIKPDPAIYELLTATYKLVPAECLFFDDTPANVEGAIRHGYNARVFEGYDKARKIIADIREGILKQP